MAQLKLLRMSGLAILGLLAMIAAGFIFIILLPYILPALAIYNAGVVLFLLFMIIFLVFYLAMVIGASLVYFFKPANVKNSGDYNIERSREAGRRKKGRKKRKTEGR